jgi:hypothetical protein
VGFPFCSPHPIVPYIWTDEKIMSPPRGFSIIRTPSGCHIGRGTSSPVIFPCRRFAL